MSGRVPTWWLALAILMAVPVSGEEPSGARISPEELLGGPVGLEAPEPALVEARGVLAVSREMQDFLGEHVDRRAPASTRLQQLASAIISARSFGLAFDSGTRTATETFEMRRGNCLSFSNMFVAMAREVGLGASFQEVDVPPDWSRQHDVFVLNRHVNVRVNLGTAGERVVDFNVDDFRESYDTRTITDTRALAHYFNNIGVERMQEGDLGAAVAYFRRALVDNDRRFSPAWTNLGTLYLRLGRPDHAEAAYQQALKADRDDTVAMSNLAGLYERRGEPERANAYRKKVANHRNRNPYFRLQRAREAFAVGDWDAAIEHLRFAIRRKRSDEEFLILMGHCFLAKGDERRARRWLDRARALSAPPGTGEGRPSGSPPPR